MEKRSPTPDEEAQFVAIVDSMTDKLHSSHLAYERVIGWFSDRFPQVDFSLPATPDEEQ
jgi:hypothetical protein